MYISLSDFRDSFVNVNTFQEVQFQNEIEEFERSYMVNIFGGKLTNFFYSDSTGTPPIPQNADLLYLFNPIIDEDCDSCGCGQNRHIPKTTNGLKNTLINFISWEHEKPKATRSTAVGAKVVKGENSNRANPITNHSWHLYNKGVRDSWLLQKKARMLFPDLFCADDLRLLMPF
jgi:hypothetical protein